MDQKGLLGLLGGASPMFDLGIGLLSATPGGTFGQALGQGVQFADQRQQQALRNEAARQQLLQQSQRRQESQDLQRFIGTLSQNPQQQQYLSLLAKVAPEAAATQIGGLLGFGAKQREFQTDTGKLFADLDLAEAQGNAGAVEAIQSRIRGSLGPAVDFDDLRNLRNDVIKNSQDYLGASQGYARVQVGAQSATPAGDLALIFGYMKTLDPTSTVREGEAASVQSAGSVPERIRGLYNRIVSGERLTPEQRADFLSQAEQQFGKNVERQQKLVEDFSGLAKRNSFPVSDVIPGYLIPDFTPGPAPERQDRSLTNLLTPEETAELQSLRRRILGAN